MTSPRFVLVTGASRGLGRDMALHLAEHGFTVLAGVRNATDAPEGMTPVVFDVTDATSIAAAARQIETFTGDTGLAGLVNNAGIAAFRPLEQQPLAEFEMLFRVNVLMTLLPYSRYALQASGQGAPVALTVLVALLVCLMPTTIGGLLSAIGIAGIDRLIRRNVIAMSGRAVEAAGDVDVLLLDKTARLLWETARPWS